MTTNPTHKLEPKRKTTRGAAQTRARSTAPRAMDKAPRQTNDLYRSLFESSRDAIILADVETRRIRDVNTAACQLLGMPRENLIGRLQSEIHPPELVEKYTNLFRGYIEKGMVLAVDMVISRADGTSVPVNLSASTVTIAGKTTLQSVFRDITERQRMEKVLIKSEEKFSKAFHAIPETLSISFLKNGVFLDVNDAFLLLHEVTRDQVIGHNFQELNLWQPDQHEKSSKMLREHGKIVNEELIFQTKSGEKRIISFSAEVITLDNEECLLAMSTDITERKHMENALRESEEKFSQAFSTSPEILIITKVDDGTIIEINESFTRLFGYSREEVIGRKTLELGLWASAEDRTSILQALEKTGQVINREVQIRTKSGNILTAIFSGAIIKINNQPHIVSVTTDITERKQMEEALRTSEEKYRDIIEMASEGIVTISFDGITLSCNRALQEILGLSAEDIVGSHFSEMRNLKQKNFPDYENAIAALARGEKIPPMEIQWDHHDGRTRVLEFRASIMKSGDNIIGIQGIIIDITERKHLEEALRASEEKYRDIVELAAEGIITTDLKGVIVSCNASFLKMIGAEPKDIIGMGFKDNPRINKQDLARYTDMSISLLKGEKTPPLEVPWLMPDGTTRIYELRSSLMKSNGEAIGAQTIAIDITERKQMEEVIRVSEEKFSKAFHNSPEGIIILDIENSVLLEANETFLRRTGYTRAEAIGQKSFDTNLWVDPKERLTALNNIMTKGGINKEEYRFHTKTGEVIFCLISTETIIVDNKPQLLIVMTDITERKQMEDKLHFSDTVLKSLHEGLFYVDKDYKIGSWNEICEQIYGIKAADAIGKLATAVYSMIEDYPGHNEKRLDILLRRGFNTEEQIHRTPRGDIWVDVHTQAITHNGTTEGWITLVTDITERKKAEADLKRSEEKYRELIDTSSDAIVSTDTQMNFIVWNRGAEKLLGYTEKEILGQSIMNIFPDAAQKDVSRQMVEARNNSTTSITSRVFETSCIKKDCALVPVEVTISMKKLENYFVATLILRDITIRKEAEEKMRQIDQMKSDFLSNVSHELRTPLQSIGGFTKLIMNGQVEDAATRQEFFEIIDRETQHLGNLINGLLDMSRLEAGRFQIYKKPIRIKDTITECVKMFQSLAREKNITLSDEIPQNIPEIEADPDRIRQVIINLLGNAIKFSEPGTSVNVKITVRNDDMLFQVSDHGTGIAEESMHHLFERFFRAAGEKVRGGTGLGLFISKQIVDAHGGRIWAESKIDKGSTFSFTLPYNKGGDQNGNTKANTGN
jgi:PAS domain S-box-containing protein